MQLSSSCNLAGLDVKGEKVTMNTVLVALFVCIFQLGSHIWYVCAMHEDVSVTDHDTLRQMAQQHHSYTTLICQQTIFQLSLILQRFE